MDFNKIAQEILELQNKVQAYQIRNNKLKELLTGLLKEYLKLEKKFEKETDELNKLYLQINMYFTKRMINSIENIYKESVQELDKKEGEK